MENSIDSLQHSNSFAMKFVIYKNKLVLMIDSLVGMNSKDFYAAFQLLQICVVHLISV